MTGDDRKIDITFRCSVMEWSLIRNNILSGLNYDEEGELIEYLRMKIDAETTPVKGIFDR